MKPFSIAFFISIFTHFLLLYSIGIECGKQTNLSSKTIFILDKEKFPISTEFSDAKVDWDKFAYVDNTSLNKQGIVSDEITSKITSDVLNDKLMDDILSVGKVEYRRANSLQILENPSYADLIHSKDKSIIFAKVKLPSRKKLGDKKAKKFWEWYRRSIYERINRNYYIPDIVKVQNLNGSVILSVKITPSGEVKEITFIKRSEFSILDELALDIVKRSAPFPDISKYIKVETIKLRVPILFTPKMD